MNVSASLFFFLVASYGFILGRDFQFSEFLSGFLVSIRKTMALTSAGCRSDEQKAKVQGPTLGVLHWWLWKKDGVSPEKVAHYVNVLLARLHCYLGWK